MNQFFNKTGGELEVRWLSESDIPEAMRLKELAGWNQTGGDWRRLLVAEPRGCFAAHVAGRLVATTTTTTYGQTLAWVGMVLVDPEYRRLGIATILMHRALDYLNEREIRTVKLDATPAGQAVYVGLGFVEETVIERWQATAPDAPQQDCAVLEDESLAGLLAFDTKVFGADRSRLLRALFADSYVRPLARLAPSGELLGYGLVREGTKATYIGPVVATGESEAAALLDGLLARLGGREVYLDLNTSFAGGRRLLADRGFTKQRDLVRMWRGREAGAGNSPWVVAIAGPEIG